jgi:hypothetical protein
MHELKRPKSVYVVTSEWASNGVMTTTVLAPLAESVASSERECGRAAKVEVYEPAVPKCRTCKNNAVDYDDVNNVSYRHCAVLTFDGGETFPQDGSGYCHEHSELRK